MTPPTVGVDLGGTRLRVALVGDDGTVLARRESPSRLGDGCDAVTTLAQLCLEVTGGEPPAAVGLATSGPVDVTSGVIDNPFTLRNWSGIPLRSALSRELGCGSHVAVDNDAAAAALAESYHGAGRGADPVAVVTLGTGIGAALVVGGRLLRGSAGFHPEAGHCLVDPQGPRCYCGAHGCWEVLASGTALTHTALAAGFASAEACVTAARDGNPRAAKITGTVARYTALGLISVSSFWAPEVIVIGGSLGSALDVMRPVIDRNLAELGPMLPPGGIRLAQAELGCDAGVVGAAMLARTPAP